ncbi:transcription factor IWS1 [Scheffersomyces amazonensis]|uniref:transcription factor IWS1 n=1 Tax=Scheffersomyces amazonensis TaxID=1078765 RepID=UPI00315DBC78
MSDVEDQQSYSETPELAEAEQVDQVQAEAETEEGEYAEAQEQEQNEEEEDEDDEDVFAMDAHKITDEDQIKVTKKKNIRKSAGIRFPGIQEANEIAAEADNDEAYGTSDPQARRRIALEEKMDQAIKQRTTRRRKADEDDIERMQDDRIELLKDHMIKAANLDVEKNSQGQIATEKLKLLKEVNDVLSRADLADSILDNNLLEAVRLWLEPLPDASMPAYQIQKQLIQSLQTLPIKTDHLTASGIGKVLVFYQRSKRTEPVLKKIVDRLIGDWTRPILNKSDSYKDRSINFADYNRKSYTNKLGKRSDRKEAKTLYEENAERRNRAAIPSRRTAPYKIAPKVDPEVLRRYTSRQNGSDERFRRINNKLVTMSAKRKVTRKGGPSIEGRNLPGF